jgi:uncharacterized protein (TIGR00251 family)
MITGTYGDAIKIKVTAPPVDGAANKACIKFLAKYFKVSKSSIEIISGQTSRTKHVLYKRKNNKEGQDEIECFKKAFEQLLNSQKTS